MTLRLTDEQAAALRAPRRANEGRSMQQVAVSRARRVPPCTRRRRRTDRPASPPPRCGAVRRFAAPPRRVTRHLTVEQALRIARAQQSAVPSTCGTSGSWTPRCTGRGRACLARTPTRICSTKAAALLHSLAANRPLVDGNKRLAWLATYVFLSQDGVELDPDDDAAYDFVIAVAVGIGRRDRGDRSDPHLVRAHCRVRPPGGDREAVAPDARLQGPHDLVRVVSRDPRRTAGGPHIRT